MSLMVSEKTARDALESMFLAGELSMSDGDSFNPEELIASWIDRMKKPLDKQD